MSNEVPEPLPDPTGPNAVGRVSYEWLDQDRAEIYSTNPDDRRELVVWVWYPAAADGQRGARRIPARGVGSERGVPRARRGWRACACHRERHPRRRRHEVPRAADVAQWVPAAAAQLACRGVGESWVRRRRRQPHVRIRGHRVQRWTGGAGEPAGRGRRARAAEWQPRRRIPGSGRGLHGQGEGPGVRRRSGRPARCRTARTGWSLAGRLDLSRMGAFGLSFGGNAALEWCRTDPRAGPL